MLFDFIKAIVLAGIPIAAFSYYLITLTRKKVQLQSTNATQLKKELKKVEMKSTAKETYIQGVLQKKFMKFGGGFYGVVTFITYLHIEGYQIIQFISSFISGESNFNGGILRLVLEFFLDMIFNFFTALMWPIYWSKHLPIESFWLWLLVAIFSHTWATRYALSKKESNI